MTAVEELERPARTVPGVPGCQAMIPVTFSPDGFPVPMRCPEPPVARFKGRCACRHDREAWLCAGCSRMLGQSGCRACLEDEGMPHECLLTVTPAAVRGGGRD